MPRRSKIEVYNLLERVIDLYENRKLSIREIENILQKDGYSVSRSAIHRSLKNYNELAAQYKCH